MAFETVSESPMTERYQTFPSTNGNFTPLSAITTTHTDDAIRSY
jgi:hypothetical protein